jgi:hypothetical protein
MKPQKPYFELVCQAEKAAQAIKDPELRRVAFERVLDDLLSAGGATGGAEKAPLKPSKGPRTAVPAKPRKARGPKGYVRDLVDDGFFKKPKTMAEVKAELANRGHHIAFTSLSGPLQGLCQERVLRRHKGKAGGKGKKVAFNYSEW